MNLDIKNLTKDQLIDEKSQIEKQLVKVEYPLKGTICKVWDNGDKGKYLVYSNGDGTFVNTDTSSNTLTWDNYEAVPQGLTFSDEVITFDDITSDMDKALCLAWDNTDQLPTMRVIDATYKCVFLKKGKRSGLQWDNYRVCTTPYELMPQWAKDIIDNLEE
ncbi:hypothetical protein TPMD03_39 [Thiohalocapsa phage LS06-2018-MD03]|nr:hypothetical protein TPMD03_39 [Thiohalocapsa phage LS06-2018-MD03]